MFVTLGWLVSVFTAPIHPDEFVLLQRAVDTDRTGTLMGGGRPGLGTLVIAQFAAACRNAVDTMVQARVLWTVVVLASVATFWILLKSVLPPTPSRHVALATGVALWALAPPFLFYSTQVRTDQPAILFGLLGGVALLASRGRPAWAFPGGLLFGVGFLFSQKLLYVGAFATVLALGQVGLRGDWRPGREARRAALAATGFVLLVLVYRSVVSTLVTTPTLLPLESQLSMFEFYREALGWRQYKLMLPYLLPQLVVLAFLFPLTLAWLRDRRGHTGHIVLAWVLIAVGMGVLLFHAGRFRYFYMVLGLFPAAVGALIVGPVLERFESAFRRVALVAVIWLPIGIFSIHFAATSLPPGHQQRQRASLEWVERNFPREATGYNHWGAFACRADRLPVQFNVQLARAYRGEHRDRNINQMLMEFRDRQVAFMIPPVVRHPEELEGFWRSHYVHYSGGIHVAGRRVRGGPDWTGTFKPIVRADYVWRSPAHAATTIEVEGYTLAPGEKLTLDEQRPYSLRLPQGGEGMLVLAVPEPPSWVTTDFFVTIGRARSPEGQRRTGTAADAPALRGNP